MMIYTNRNPHQPEKDDVDHRLPKARLKPLLIDLRGREIHNPNSDIKLEEANAVIVILRELANELQVNFPQTTVQGTLPEMK